MLVPLPHLFPDSCLLSSTSQFTISTIILAGKNMSEALELRSLSLWEPSAGRQIYSIKNDQKGINAISPLWVWRRSRILRIEAFGIPNLSPWKLK